MPCFLRLGLVGLGAFGLPLTIAKATPPADLQQPLIESPCELLALHYPDAVFGPGDANYTRKYWAAQQEDLQPTCRFVPKTARHVQAALADILIPNNATIAITSGGHSSIVGASNVDHGITIDLRRLDEVNFFLDQGKEVFLGPGNTWDRVYSILDGVNLTVPGARSGSVGVGGYALGGGLSWYTSQIGWAMDSIVELQIITPRAEVLKLQPHAGEDLFWAMRGSLGALGIVTSIKMKTIPNNGLHGGALTYSQRYIPRLCNALEFLAQQTARYQNSTQGYLSFTWEEAKQDFTYTAYLANTEGKERDDVQSRFKVIPHTGSTLRQMTLRESAQEVDKTNIAGLRRSKFTLTSTATTAAMMAIHESVKALVGGANFEKRSTLSVTFQPVILPQDQTQTNMFHLNPTRGPLLVVSVEFGWSGRSKDDYFETTAGELRRSLEKELKKLDALEPFVYPNYAARDQNLLDSFSPVSRKMLTETRRKYDPDCHWRAMVPGVWHV